MGFKDSGFRAFKVVGVSGHMGGCQKIMVPFWALFNAAPSI